jgi:hypothetical protein
VNFYVAGKYEDYERVREVQETIRGFGHGITYDWTDDVEYYLTEGDNDSITPEIEAQLAARDLDGVRRAMIVVAVSNEHWCGTLIEIGIALDQGKRVWILGPFVHRHSIFFRLRQFLLVETMEEMRSMLQSLPT